MIKGTNRQMIVVKLAGSGFFDSACFILRRDAQRGAEAERDMLCEANRIVLQMDARRKNARRGGWKSIILGASMLMLGAAIGFFLSFFI